MLLKDHRVRSGPEHGFCVSQWSLHRQTPREQLCSNNSSELHSQNLLMLWRWGCCENTANLCARFAPDETGPLCAEQLLWFGLLQTNIFHICVPFHFSCSEQACVSEVVMMCYCSWWAFSGPTFLPFPDDSWPRGLRVLFCLIFVVLGIEPRVLCVQGKCSPTELHELCS